MTHEEGQEQRDGKGLKSGRFWMISSKYNHHEGLL